MVAAHTLGLADKLQLIRSVAVMTKPNPAIMADNPLNKIPTLILDNGAVLTDSRVICEYLDALAGGGRIIPPAGAERWTALAWAAQAEGLTDLLILWRNEREKPVERQTPAWIEAFQFKADAVLDRFEHEIDAIAGAPFSVAHIGLGCVLAYLDFRFDTFDWRASRPGLNGWYGDFQALPAARATEIVDG